MCSLGNFLCSELNLVPGFKANLVKQKHENEKYKINKSYIAAQHAMQFVFNIKRERLNIV